MTNELLLVSKLFPTSLEETENFDVQKRIELLKKYHFNADQVDLTQTNIGKGDTGVYYFKTSAARAVPRDVLAEYSVAAAKEGIKLLTYFNVHWAAEFMAKAHPDWIQYDKNKAPIGTGSYNEGAFFCVNSPWRDYAAQIAEDMARYDILGIFLDGPIFSGAGCYCEHCEKKFGSRLPQSAEEADWKKFQDFRSRSIFDFIGHLKNGLKKSSQKVMLFSNAQGGFYHTLDFRRNVPANRELTKYVDMLGAEGGCLRMNLVATYSYLLPGLSAKRLESQAGGKATFNFISGRHLNWSRYLLPPAEMKLVYAQTVANGANPEYMIFSGDIGKPGALAVGEINKFLQENAKLFEGAESMAEVAMLVSDQTANCYTSPEDLGDTEYKGMVMALMQSHIPFDLIDDHSLADKEFFKYKTLILPNCACLSAHQIENIKDYVRGGGTIIATYETSHYDEIGRRASDLQLGDLFGVTSLNKPNEMGAIDNISVTDPAFRDLSQTLIPATMRNLAIENRGGEGAAYFHEKMKSPYSELPPVSSSPALMLNSYGKGRTAYFPGTFGGLYWKFRFPEYMALLAGLVTKFNPAGLCFKGLPQSVEVVVRRQEKSGRRLIHLISSLEGGASRPVEYILPRDIKLRIGNLGDMKSAAFFAEERQGEKLENEAIGGEVSFAIKGFKEYGIVVID